MRGKVRREVGRGEGSKCKCERQVLNVWFNFVGMRGKINVEPTEEHVKYNTTQATNLIHFLRQK